MRLALYRLVPQTDRRTNSLIDEPLADRQEQTADLDIQLMLERLQDSTDERVAKSRRVLLVAYGDPGTYASAILADQSQARGAANNARRDCPSWAPGT